MSSSKNEQLRKEVYEDYQKGMTYKKICEKHRITKYRLKQWQQRYKWTREKPKAGNKKSMRTRGGQQGNQNARTDGLFSKYYPTDVQKIFEDISNISGLDILWSSIEMQYISVLRAHKLMFVKDQEDTTEKLKRSKNGELEFEIQFAWDKHDRYMNALSRASNSLSKAIEKYEEMLHKNWDMATEEQRTRIEILKGKIESKEEENVEDDGFLDALKGKGENIWEE